MQQELSAAAKQAGSDDAVRQSLRTLQDAQQGLETRLSALTEQLTALKSQPAPTPAAPVAAPVKNAPAAKSPVPLTHVVLLRPFAWPALRLLC